MLPVISRTSGGAYVFRAGIVIRLRVYLCQILPGSSKPCRYAIAYVANPVSNLLNGFIFVG